MTKPRNDVAAEPQPTPAPDACAALPNFWQKAGLADDFDAELNKLAARGPAHVQHYKEATAALGETLKATVEAVLGREVKQVVPLLGPSLLTGRLDKGGAVFFVDNVSKGGLSVGLDTAQSDRPGLYKPTKGRLVLIPGPASYTLDVSNSLTRTAILFA